MDLGPKRVSADARGRRTTRATFGPRECRRLLTGAGSPSRLSQTAAVASLRNPERGARDGVVSIRLESSPQQLLWLPPPACPCGRRTPRLPLRRQSADAALPRRKRRSESPLCRILFSVPFENAICGPLAPTGATSRAHLLRLWSRPHPAVSAAGFCLCTLSSRSHLPLICRAAFPRSFLSLDIILSPTALCYSVARGLVAPRARLSASSRLPTNGSLLRSPRLGQPWGRV